MHAELARRRAYVHPLRWTSLGLSLLEAMHLGMPVVALGTTEVVEAVPPEAGPSPPTPSELVARRAAAASTTGRGRGSPARPPARRRSSRYGLARFLADWDAVLATRQEVPSAAAVGTGKGVR